jgi:hypothetical protein
MGRMGLRYSDERECGKGFVYLWRAEGVVLQPISRCAGYIGPLDR